MKDTNSFLLMSESELYQDFMNGIMLMMFHEHLHNHHNPRQEGYEILSAWKERILKIHYDNVEKVKMKQSEKNDKTILSDNQQYNAAFMQSLNDVTNKLRTMIDGLTIEETPSW